MLLYLNLENFLLVKKTAIDFNPGMTVLTGETGAGKSILLNALGLTLGTRGSVDLIRKPAARLTVTAGFDIEKNSAVQEKLTELELPGDDELILRRIISSDGKSKAFINDSPVTLAKLKEVGVSLVDIYGQHSHQALTSLKFQRERLDRFGGCEAGARDVAQAFNRLKSLTDHQQKLEEETRSRLDRMELLSYQLEEFENLAIKESECEELELEEQRLSAAENALTNLDHALTGISGEDNSVLTRLNVIMRDLDKLTALYPALANAAASFNNAIIELGEAQSDIKLTLDNIEINPGRLQKVQERLAAIYDLARKHKCDPDQIIRTFAALKSEFTELSSCEQDLKALGAEIVKARGSLEKNAKLLSKKRAAAACKLAQKLSTQIKKLGMEGANFEIRLVPDKNGEISSFGAEQVKFMLEANPGQGYSAVGNIASGGELSRIGLAVQVITTDGFELPVKIFDEVDAGIGGKTADIVGNLLKNLSAHAQVLCVTHLAQVAVKGDNHLKVEKNIIDKQVYNSVKPVSGNERVEEIARMLGGSKISRKTLSHAEELLGVSA